MRRQDPCRLSSPELLLMRRVIEEHWQTSGADIESILESHRKALSLTATQQTNFAINRWRHKSGLWL